jgi:hypothetical protein
MRKLDLTEWAALGELVATVAVVASLVFLVFSINQNTAALQGNNDNSIFEQHGELMSHFIADPSMAEILNKKRSGDTPLSPVEAIRWEKYETSLLDIWVMAYTRHRAGLLAEEHWEPWNDYFVEVFTYGDEKLSRERWIELQFGYEVPFWEHVDAALFGADSKARQTSQR